MKTWALMLVAVSISQGFGNFAAGQVAVAYSRPACSAASYEVVASRWDAVLGKGWELRRDCVHPEWPVRSVEVTSLLGPQRANKQSIAMKLSPIVVHAGDTVRLWQQEENVRIEMLGVAEQSGRAGESAVVRVMRQSDDAGATVRRITGVVRGAGNVEMER